MKPSTQKKNSNAEEIHANLPVVIDRTQHWSDRVSISHDVKWSLMVVAIVSGGGGGGGTVQHISYTNNVLPISRCPASIRPHVVSAPVLYQANQLHYDQYQTTPGHFRSIDRSRRLAMISSMHLQDHIVVIVWCTPLVLTRTNCTIHMIFSANASSYRLLRACRLQMIFPIGILYGADCVTQDKQSKRPMHYQQWINLANAQLHCMCTTESQANSNNNSNYKQAGRQAGRASGKNELSVSECTRC
jgi:hypothetical protein